MATTGWAISGQYCETCNCDFVCPCVPGGLAVTPTKGSCTFVMAYRIDRGQYQGITLDGLSFILVGVTPEAMGKGNWSVGVIVDQRASAEQRDAIAAIASGQAGGPVAALGGLVGQFLGVESAPIEFTGSGNKWAVSSPGRLDMAMAGVLGLSGSPEPIYLDNTGHPAADRFALARAERSHFHAFGIDWDDTSGKNNGQFAPFSWRSA
jgi:hypothetical protein